MTNTMQQPEKIKTHVRWLIRRDMPEVLDAERLSFDFPWIDEDFLRCLRQRNCIGMVAEHGKVADINGGIIVPVVGFMLYEMHKYHLHVLNFAVHPCWRRLGVGKAMADRLISKLSRQRRTSITLEVLETNLAAQMFFKAQGFEAIEVVRGFYEDSGEDAYLMAYRLVRPSVIRSSESEEANEKPITL